MALGSLGCAYAERLPRCERPLLGVHSELTSVPDVETRARVVSALRSVLHARVARTALLWHDVERRRGERDWRVTDAVVDALVEAGIEPLFVIVGSPAWANEAKAGTTRGNPQLYIPRKRRAFARWVREYARFVHEAARRYDRVRYWEVWNEPNLARFWRPRPDADRYAAFYRAISAAIRIANRDARIAIGGIASLAAARGRDMPGLAFLDHLTGVAGVRPDAVALHPYTTPPHDPDAHLPGENNFGDIEAARSLLERNGARAPIWITEWGWSERRVGRARQAAYVQRSLELLATRFRSVTLATYFADRDLPPRFFHGLLDESLRPKPAASAFADAARATC